MKVLKWCAITIVALVLAAMALIWVTDPTNKKRGGH